MSHTHMDVYVITSPEESNKKGEERLKHERNHRLLPAGSLGRGGQQRVHRCVVLVGHGGGNRRQRVGRARCDDRF